MSHVFLRPICHQKSVDFLLPCRDAGIQPSIMSPCPKMRMLNEELCKLADVKALFPFLLEKCISYIELLLNLTPLFFF